MSLQHDTRELIRRRLQELPVEQRPLELRYQANARAIAELENLLRRVEAPPSEPAGAESRSHAKPETPEAEQQAAWAIRQPDRLEAR